MKKILALLLASLMLLSLVACNGGNETQTDKNDAETNNVQNEDTTAAGEAQPEVKLPAVIKENTEITYDDPTTTLGYYFWQKFVEVKTADASANSSKVVEEIFNSNLVNAIQMPMAYEVTSDMPLSGFFFENADGEEIKIEGFESGYLFGSGMMGVAFIGYAFDLAEGTDATAFIKTLDENKDIRWNCCTTADMTIIDAIGNTVFFVMCPIPAPYTVTGIPEINKPANLEAGSVEEKVWNKYVEILTENYELSAVEVCEAIAAELGYETEIVDHSENGVPAENFQFEIYADLGAASIAAKNGDSTKVVYVFNNYDGLDFAGWTDYYFVMGGKYETVFGAFNASIIAIVDTAAPIAE